MAKAMYQKAKQALLVIDHPVKTTAMCYLKEALIHERYEECSGIIEGANEFGASQQEIQKTINSI